MGINQINAKLFAQYEITHDECIRDALIKNNMGLVISLAKKMHHTNNCGVGLCDLVQEGAIGLIRAVEKYRTEHKATFSTYATFWIKQKIGRYLRKNEFTIHVPLGVQFEVKKTMDQKTFFDLSSIFPRRCDEIGFQPWHQSVTNPYDELDCKIHTMEMVDKIKMGLTKDESYLIDMRWGLSGHKPHTLDEIAKKNRMSREGVRKRILRIVDKIKNNIETEKGEYNET